MVESAGTLFRIARYAVHDGPGIRTTVFLKGCPLRCAWCHSPESQCRRPQLLVHPERDERVTCGYQASVDDVLARIERDRPFYDESGGGVTFSGGEPLAQPRFLRALIDACRAREIHTAVETSGYAPPAALAGIRPDLFLVDLKIMDEERHRAATGVSNRRILANVRTLAAGSTPVRLRFPLVPGVNDDEANRRALAGFVRSIGMSAVDVLPYHRAGIAKYARLHRAYSLVDTPEPTPAQIDGCRIDFERAGIVAQIGG
jgi:pyruvate formate lyase activating enzyme